MPHKQMEKKIKISVVVVKHWTRLPERLWCLLPWRCSKLSWTQSWATCSSCPCFEQGGGVDDLQRWLPTSTVRSFCDSTLTWFKARVNLSLELGRLLPFLSLRLLSPTLSLCISAAVCPDCGYFPLLSHWLQRELDRVLNDIMLRRQRLSPLRKSVGMRYLAHLWISANSATFLKNIF